MNKYKFYFNIITLVISILCSLIIGSFFSMLLDFFPWGDKGAYVIWEPLLLNYIIPYFIVVGILKIFINRRINFLYGKMSFFIAVFLFAIPSFIGFDLAADFLARWIGVISSLILICIFIFEIKTWLKIRHNKLTSD